MVWLTEAKTPDNLRIYAVGDVHGCLEHLHAVHDWIADDLVDRPANDWNIVHLGDYVDRGPDSRGVLDFLVDRSQQDPHILNLMGNHDLMFEAAIAGDQRLAQIWLRNGGRETLASYGLTTEDYLNRLTSGAGFADVIPSRHLDFLRTLDHAAILGDFMFVHAGIRPGVSLDDQNQDDLLWIREGFVDSGEEFEAVIIHGHTPTRRIDLKANRVGIDTGAVYGGDLTCLILDGEIKTRLGPNGRRPLL